MFYTADVESGLTRSKLGKKCYARKNFSLFVHFMTMHVYDHGNVVTHTPQLCSYDFAQTKC